MNLKDLYVNELDILPKAYDYVNAQNETLSFNHIDAMAEYHQSRILKYMKECQVAQRHFSPSTGYGYGDDGRDTLDKLFALVFGGEDALVRTQWCSGTHVISDSLFALLRPGDSFLSITGLPYDTLRETIGIEKQDGSLTDWNIVYRQVDLTCDGHIDIPQMISAIKQYDDIKMIFIQRSRGYSWRPSISINELKKVILKIKQLNPNIQVLVDNCYGEFTEQYEPVYIGADLMVGSLIKNPGGGLAPTGAYAIGTHRAIKKLSYRLTSPGIGREVGSYAASYLPFYQGFFMAPYIVGQAIKGVTLAAKVFSSLGYKVLPEWNGERSDIIQSIQFKTPDELIAFCQAIQSASPVDSHVLPYPWDMPGYNHQVIMAAGTFIEGASIELSADAPIKKPYIAYMQGGLTYPHVKFALMKALSALIEKGYIIL